MTKEELEKQLEHDFKAALECLGIKSSIGIKYEYNSERFDSYLNAAECDKVNLYINEAWIDKLIELDDFYDAKYIMYHEARHIYQAYVIKDYQERGRSSELPATIKAWIDNLNNYKRNTSEDSVDDNANQTVEIDANAFAIVLLQMQKIKEVRLNSTVEEATTALAKQLYNKYGKKEDEWIKILSK